MWRLSGPLKPCYVFSPGTLVRRMRLHVQPPASTIQRVELPWGSPLEVNTEETIGREIFRQGIFDIAVSEIACRLLRPGDVAVDVGANIGYMTSLFAARVGSGGRVESFEPHPAVFGKLKRNVAIGSGAAAGAAIRLHNCALGERAGTARLVEPGHFGSNEGIARLASGDATLRPGEGSGALDVPIMRLDSMLADDTIRLMKVDVEGYELQVLEGCSRMLEERRIENIVYEAHECAGSPVHGMLHDRGYRVFGIGYGLLGPRLTEGTRAPEIDTTWESPNYLATTDGEGAITLMRGRGWRVLDGWRRAR